jgi:hypothetical protein
MNLGNSKIIYYVLYYVLFAIGQALSMWGQYVTLPYTNLTYWQAFSMAIPFAWSNWLFTTFAIDIGHTYDIASPTQDTFLLIVLQFSYLLIINRFYLKKHITKSDIYAFFIILIGYAVSLFQLVSKAIGKKVPKTNKKTEDGDEFILDNSP